MNKRVIMLTTGHVLALILGISFARAWHSHDGKTVVSDSGLRTTSASSSEIEIRTARVSRRDKSADVPLDATVFQGAWQEMQRQSPADRARLRLHLLAKWAEVDLTAALAAAVQEPDSVELLLVFDELFKKDPEAFRPLLVGERFGLKSAEVRNWWIDHMSGSDPDGLLASIGDFNDSDQKKIVVRCAEAMTGDPAKIWAMVGDFARRPDTAANRKLWALAAREAAARDKPETVVEKLSAIPGAAGDAMIAEAMTVLLEKTDYAGARATYDSLSADLKPQIVQAALRAPGSNAGAFLAAMDEVINTPQWTELQKPLAVKLHDMFPSRDQYPMMLEWAAKLPERDDTMDLYRVAVRKYVTYQPDEAREWIGAMSGGWKQQNSLTSYAQSALFARGDVAGAEWARQQVVDPRFRAEVDGMFKTYEQKNKGK